ncbi:hypothetical protein CBF23_014590 [Marinomonas agarivorans]|nr:hypothetical protein CBF23_014590 [Marinomonas agarivorans]
MLIKLSYHVGVKAFQEQILNLDGWRYDEAINARINTVDTCCLYSQYDSNTAEKTVILLAKDTVTLRRNGSAEVPLFYFSSDDSLFISDSIYELQHHLKQPLDVESAYQYLYSQFLPQQKTLFQGITQVLNQQQIRFTARESEFVMTLTDNFSLPMAEFNDRSEQQLTLELREKITAAHAARLGENNAIFLSGGLDSQVMAIALSKDLGLGQHLTSLHFSVKDARQSELEDAKLTAKTLALPFHAIEVDAEQEIDFATLLRANAPYIGAISIQQLLQSAELEQNTTVFAGQDTRLHTPSLQRIDEKLLSLYRLPSFDKMISHLSSILLSLKNSLDPEFESKRYRQLAFFKTADSIEKYLANRFFHIANLPFQDTARVQHLQAEIANVFDGINTADKRSLFNTIVLQLWRRQFIYDINYMYDTITSNKHKVAMPFYDMSLAHYSAQLPFHLAAKMTKGRAGHGAKEVSVNKYLLRKAYEGELDDSLVFRDKAVCLTAHMFFNGGLSHELEGFMYADWLTTHSVAQALHLPELQKLCKRKHHNWLESDHWLMMTVFNALVIYHHLRAIN